MLVLAIGIGGALAFAFIVAARRRGAPPRPMLSRQELVTLALQGDGPAIASLLDLHRPYDAGSRIALIRVLGAVRPDVAASFGPERQAAMARLISRGAAWDDPDLAIAVLGALTHIGQARALDAVRFLACAEERDAHSAVREAASACLPIIEARAQQCRRSGALLRPAEAPSDALLRPAAARSTDADSLLLPSRAPR
jgi:hypothetical protein